MLSSYVWSFTVIVDDGILEVEGAEGDSVVFTSLYPDTMRYPGIRFRSGSRGIRMVFMLMVGHMGHLKL